MLFGLNVSRRSQRRGSITPKKGRNRETFPAQRDAKRRRLTVKGAIKKQTAAMVIGAIKRFSRRRHQELAVCGSLLAPKYLFPPPRFRRDFAALSLINTATLSAANSPARQRRRLRESGSGRSWGERRLKVRGFKWSNQD